MDQVARLRLLAEDEGWEEISAVWKGATFSITFKLGESIGRKYNLTVTIRDEVFTGAFFDTGLDLVPFSGLHSWISELFQDGPADLIKERGISGHFGFYLTRETMFVGTIFKFVGIAMIFSDRLYEAIRSARAAVIDYRDQLIKARDTQDGELI